MLLLALFLLQTEAIDWVDRNACPTWEDCGAEGVRCYYRAKEQTNAACAEQLMSYACQAGSSPACLQVDLHDARGGHRVMLYTQAIGRDVVHSPGKFWTTNLFLIVLVLFVIEWSLLRQMGWRTLGVALRDALVMNLVSAPVVLILLGEFDLLGWWAVGLAWFFAILLEWAVLSRLAPPPYHQPLGAAILANTLSGLLVMGGVLAWRKWAPHETGFLHALRELGALFEKPQQLGILVAGWAVLLAVEALMLRATSWSSFGRSARDSLLMNLAALVPVGLVIVLGAGVFYHDHSRRALIIILSTAWLTSLMVKSWVLGRVKPQPLSRPVAGAFLANLVSWAVAGGAVYFLQRTPI